MAAVIFRDGIKYDFNGTILYEKLRDLTLIYGIFVVQSKERFFIDNSY